MRLISNEIKGMKQPGETKLFHIMNEFDRRLTIADAWGKATINIEEAEIEQIEYIYNALKSGRYKGHDVIIKDNNNGIND